MAKLNYENSIKAPYKEKVYEVEWRVVDGQSTVYFKDDSKMDLTIIWNEDEKDAAFRAALANAKALVREVLESY